MRHTRSSHREIRLDLSYGIGAFDGDSKLTLVSSSLHANDLTFSKKIDGRKFGILQADNEIQRCAFCDWHRSFQQQTAETHVLADCVPFRNVVGGSDQDMNRVAELKSTIAALFAEW